MPSEHDLSVAREITDRLLAAAGSRVRRVFLHGSRAAGKARPTSDFDVLVVVRDPVEDWVSESMRLTDLFNGFRWPVDVQTFGETEFEASRTVPGTLAYPASTRGVLLYADSVRDPGEHRSAVDGARA